MPDLCACVLREPRQMFVAPLKYIFSWFFCAILVAICSYYTWCKHMNISFIPHSGAVCPYYWTPNVEHWIYHLSSIRFIYYICILTLKMIQHHFRVNESFLCVLPYTYILYPIIVNSSRYLWNMLNRSLDLFIDDAFASFLFKAVRFLKTEPGKRKTIVTATNATQYI